MSIFLDSSIFLRLLLDEPGAGEAQNILEMIEDNKVIGYTTPMILEEVSFKLVYAKVSELLDTVNVWRIREVLRLDENVRSKCIELLKKFHEYIEYLTGRGLRLTSITYDDWRSSIEVIRRCGLLPADSIHVAIALRVGADAIATFDTDFKNVKEIRVTP